MFQQSSCLKSYIAFNTEKGKHTANDFEKRLFNLINNFLIDKTMGNLSKRVNVKVVKNYLKLTNLTASPSFDSFRIYFKDLAALNMKKTKLYLNRPIYVGFAIFYLSKVFMYQIYYDCMKRTLGPIEKLYFLPTPIVFATTWKLKIFIKICYKMPTFSTHLNMTKTIHYTAPRIRRSLGRWRMKRMQFLLRSSLAFDQRCIRSCTWRKTNK